MEDLKNHATDRLRTVSSGGGFILSSEGDLPYEMNYENLTAFLEISRKSKRNTPFA